MSHQAVRPCERVIDFAGFISDLVIARCSQEQHWLVNALVKQLGRQIQFQVEVQDHAQRPEVDRNNLMRELELLGEN